MDLVRGLAQGLRLRKPILGASSHISGSVIEPMNAAADMLDYYGRRAAEYERIYQKPERQEDLKHLHRMVPAFFKGANVLEVACGTGYWTEAIAHSVRSIRATDFSPEVLDVARHKAYPAGRVIFEVANGFNLSPVKGRFDAGFAGFWWSHVPRDDQQAFLEGFHACLEPGSRVLLLDNRFVEGSSTPISRTDDRGNTYQVRTLDDGSTHEVLKNFPSLEELHAAVDRAAVDVAVTELPYFWYLTYRLR
jgi:ubiquinone/menaquinone biosynthesis C-methylase UbiE